MLWCQGAQNIGLSKNKLKSALKCTIRSVHPMTTMHARSRQTDRQTDEHHGNSATIRSNERIAR